MNPTSANPQPTPSQSEDNPLHAMRSGETELFTIKRHPIGLLGIYVPFSLLLLIVAGSAIAAPNILTDMDRTLVSNIGLIVFLIAVAFAALYMFIARKVYYGNRWIVTSDSLTQINQNGLFSNQNSQLGLGNLEDVTVQQDGILSHMFNYGLLKAQTAGEHSKFQFTYCPNPNDYAQKILVAHENFEQGNMYDEQQPSKAAQ